MSANAPLSISKVAEARVVTREALGRFGRDRREWRVERGEVVSCSDVDCMAGDTADTNDDDEAIWCSAGQPRRTLYTVSTAYEYRRQKNSSRTASRAHGRLETRIARDKDKNR